MASFVNDPLSEDASNQDESDVCLCTFAVTGASPMHQAIYRCETCHPNEDRCCCVGCMNVCHAGHDVSFIAFGDGFCDCGLSCCQLAKDSQAEALRVLDNNFHTANPDIVEIAAKYDPMFTVHKVEGFEKLNDVLREQAVALVEQSKETFWIAHHEAPRCHFETLAKSIGLYHLQKLFSLSPCFEELLSVAGFEWWVQVKPSQSDANPALSSRGPIGVDLHYDKDEEMAASFELGVFPTVSTVTYVANSVEYFHPTVVLDCTAASPVGNPILDCFISLPELGKHIAFDGRLLHGAPSELLPFAHANRSVRDDVKDAQRITFLVNVWVAHRPASVVALSPEIAQSLNEVYNRWYEQCGEHADPQNSTISLSQIEGFQGVPVRVKEQDAQRDDLGDWLSIPFVSNKAEWGKSEDETGLDLAMWLPQHSVDRFLDASGGKTRKRRAVGNDNDIDTPLTAQTFHFQYVGDNAAARLDYEDEDGEEDLMGDFEGL